jgi:hypothetical protein
MVQIGKPAASGALPPAAPAPAVAEPREAGRVAAPFGDCDRLGDEQSPRPADPRAPRAAAQGGLAAGGTVGHLTGFRDARVLSAKARATVEALASFARDAAGEPTPEAIRAALDKVDPRLFELRAPGAANAAGLVRLHPAIASELVQQRLLLTTAEILGRPAELGLLTSAKLLVAVRIRKKVAEISGKRDEALCALTRLSRNGRERMDVALDPNTGAIVIAERDHPLEPRVAERIRPDVGRRIAESMLRNVSDRATARDVVMDVAKTFPTDALELIQKTGARIDIVPRAELEAVDPRIVALLGQQTADEEDPASPETEGRYSAILGDVCLGSSASDRAEHRGTLARHELAHLLDHILGKDGRFLSEMAEFRAIYDPACRGGCEFPTEYARTAAAEFFAEAVACYLGTHVGNMQGLGDQVTTRADLARANRAAYAFVEKVFLELVPRALAEGRIRGPETRPSNQHLALRVAEAERVPEEARSAGEWRKVGIAKALLGGVTGSVTVLEEARRANGKAKAKAARVLGVIPIPGAAARIDSQNAAIERNLGRLKGGAK